MLSFFRQFVLLSWTYEDHDLQALQSFPDSQTFYSVDWQRDQAIQSVFYVSTCNRAELYLELKGLPPKDSVQIRALLMESPVNLGVHRHEPVHKSGSAAIRHLFQVTSGLKSMAIGETQITGQVKRAMALAEEKLYLSAFFRTLLQKTFEVQKAIRTHTDIGSNPISLLSLMERAILSRWKQDQLVLEKAVIGGTGDMSQKALRFVLNKGAQEILILRHDITNPLPPAWDKAIHGTSVSIRYLNWSDFFVEDQHDYELLITSTASDTPLLREEQILEWKQSGKISPRAIFADLGLPPNIETLSQNDSSEHIINLNDLQNVSANNKTIRQYHLKQALPFVDRAINSLSMDLVYRQNPDLVNEALRRVEEERKQEWEALLKGPLRDISAKQQRILYDHFRKQEKKTLKAHKNLFIEMLTYTQEEA